VPEFIELKNSLPKSPDLNSVNYSVWSIVTDSMATKFQ